MRKLWLLIAGILILSGCRGKQELETVMDHMDPLQPAAKMEMIVNLPENAAAETMVTQDDSQIWFCGDYVLTQEIRHSGDIHKTLEETTGYAYENLSVMHTQQNGIKRYECVWTSAGEGGDQIGRCAVLDDGNYHYVLAVMTNSADAGNLTESVFHPLFSSYCLAESQS